MTIMANARFPVPGSPYELWVRGELAAAMGLSDRFRVEVVGGTIVVSPSAAGPHNTILFSIVKAVNLRSASDPAFTWECLAGTDLDLFDIGEGYIPDLMLLTEEGYERMSRPPTQRNATPEMVGLVIEVTSPSNAANDRMPTDPWRRTKWNGYAFARIPFYLLIDRDPKIRTTTLYGKPKPMAGTYECLGSWQFGEDVLLPPPLGLKLSSDNWTDWNE